MNIFNEMRFIYSLTLNSRSVIRSVILSGRFERNALFSFQSIKIPKLPDKLWAD